MAILITPDSNKDKTIPIIVEKKLWRTAKKEVMLDIPKMAEGFAYYSIGGRSVSENNRILAYGVDTVSRREYTLHFKNFRNGRNSRR